MNKIRLPDSQTPLSQNWPPHWTPQGELFQPAGLDTLRFIGLAQGYTYNHPDQRLEEDQLHQWRTFPTVGGHDQHDSDTVLEQV